MTDLTIGTTPALGGVVSWRLTQFGGGGGESEQDDESRPVGVSSGAAAAVAAWHDKTNAKYVVFDAVVRDAPHGDGQARWDAIQCRACPSRGGKPQLHPFAGCGHARNEEPFSVDKFTTQHLSQNGHQTRWTALQRKQMYVCSKGGMTMSEGNKPFPVHVPLVPTPLEQSAAIWCQTTGAPLLTFRLTASSGSASAVNTGEM